MAEKILPEIHEALIPAMKIFIEELKGHLLFFEGAMGRTELSSKDAEALESRFHVIRGGSGFLQLTEVRQVAERGERFFRDWKAGRKSTDEIRETLQATVPVIREWFEVLLRTYP